MKKIVPIILAIVLILPLVAAQSITIEFPKGDKVESGSDLTIKTNLFDASNAITDGQITITINNPNKDQIFEEVISSKEIVNLDLGANPIAGEWKITAKSGDIVITEPFFVTQNEVANYQIIDDILTITNTGNSRYVKDVEIIIGETSGTKSLDLDIGEDTKLTLVAPDGIYNIQINVDGNSVYAKNNVPLKGRGLTGEAIGVLDESTSGRGGITGGISPSEDDDQALLSYVKGNKFVYVFILIIFGATILLAIERRYRRKAR